MTFGAFFSFLRSVAFRETLVVLISLLPTWYFIGVDWNIDEVVLGRDFTCSLVGGFSRALRLMATVPVCRAAWGPVAGDLEVELEQRVSSFMLGAVLIAQDNLVLPQFCGCLEHFLESGLWTSAACLEKNSEKCFRKKERKQKEKSSYRKLRFPVFVHTLNKNCEKFEFLVAVKFSVMTSSECDYTFPLLLCLPS